MSLRRIGRRRYNILNRVVSILGERRYWEPALELRYKDRSGKESIKCMFVWEAFCKLWD
jgi:hypothetical protein